MNRLVLPATSTDLKVALLVACSVVFVIAFSIALVRPATYQSESYVLLGPPDAQRAAIISARNEVDKLSAYASSAQFTRVAADTLGTSVSQIHDSLTIHHNRIGRWVGIEVRHEEPWAAARAANYLADQFIADAPTSIERSLLVSAPVPTRPVASVPQGPAFFASLVSLLVGGSIRLLIVGARKPIRGVADVARVTGASVYHWDGQPWVGAGGGEMAELAAGISSHGSTVQVGIIAPTEGAGQSLATLLATQLKERGHPVQLSFSEADTGDSHSERHADPQLRAVTVAVLPWRWPPITPWAEPLDHVILAVRVGETPRSALRERYQQLAAGGGRTISVVVIDRRVPSESLRVQPEWAVMD